MMKGDKIFKITIIILTIIALTLVIFAVEAFAANWTRRQDAAHQIAELARSMGLPEDDPIITRAQEIWREDEGTAVLFTDEEIEIIATVIYNEAGNGCTEEHQLLVGRVLVNRVADGRFGGNTVYDIVCAPAQYRPEYANGDSRFAIPNDRRDEFIALAQRAAAGEPYDCPSNVLYQDNKRHGTGTYKQFYSELLRSTTYFCYG